MRVLFLCTGNICRSPMAERLLRARLAELGVGGVEVESAGFVSMNRSPACPVASTLMFTRGVSMSTHRSKVVTAETLERADLILTMEARHLSMARAMAPAVERRIALFATYLQGREGMDIPDPYKGSAADYMAAYELIREGIEKLAERLARP